MAVLTTPTKVVQTQPLAWTDIASTAGTVSVGSAIDVTTVLAASFFIRMGRQSGSAFTSGWPNVRIEAAFEDSPDNDSWLPLWSYQFALGASIGNTTLTALNNIGDTTSAFTATTNFAVGNICYIKDSSTANYEIARIAKIASLVITWEAPLANAHANGTQVTNQAELAQATLGLECYKKIRVVADNASGGQAFACEVSMIAETNLSSA